MIETPGGILVPDHLVERKQRRIPKEIFNRVRRLHFALKPEKLSFLLICEECNLPVELTTEPFGFKCKCTQRTAV